MKRQVLLSVLAAIAIFAVTTTAEAGMFGRLSVIRGCAPCEPACEAACDPCEPACAPCEVACDPCGSPCGKKPFRPFGGFFLRMKAKMAAKGCGPCAPECSPCEPCEPACCEPCEPACDPCEAACDPCCSPCGRKPFLPFNGFFLNLRNRMACKLASCNPCCEVSCTPCEPACDPCNPCN